MISLRKHIEGYSQAVVDAWRAAYASGMHALARAGGLAVPALASGLRQTLDSISERASSANSPEEIAAIRQELDQTLAQWGENAANHSGEQLDHLREIVMAVATSASSVAERDDRYRKRFGALTESLNSIARLDDLKSMRQSVIESASEIRTCVEKMTEEGERSVSQLKAELAQYRTRLLEIQHRSSLDPLTGLANRQALDKRIEARMSRSTPFCVAVIDLNGFKQINDQRGHTAGDDLLKQFAGELSVLFRTGDLIGRWGGDEFVAVLDASIEETESLMNRVRKWAFGEYKIGGEGKSISIHLSGAIGIAAWNKSESAPELFHRADQSMYVDKENSRAESAVNGRRESCATLPAMAHG